MLQFSRSINGLPSDDPFFKAFNIQIPVVYLLQFHRFTSECSVSNFILVLLMSTNMIFNTC